jgi:nucleotide-binding universal stress UspA family protein
MTGQGPMIVPLDGSQLAEQAVPVAAALARAADAELHLVHVHVATSAEPIHVEGLPVVDEHLRPRWREHAQAYLDQARHRLASGDRVSTVLLEGPIAPALASHARARGASLVVLTTHGRGGFQRAWLGSVADDLIRVSPVPLLLLRPEPGPAPGPFRRILVPLDGSPLAESILEHAVRLARLEEAAEIALFSVVPDVLSVGLVPASGAAIPAGDLTRAERDRTRAYLEAVAGKLKADGLPVRTRVEVAGNVAGTILEAARDEHADLVALSTHGQSGLRRLALGSIADKLVRGSPTPVLLFRPLPSLSAKPSA